MTHRRLLPLAALAALALVLAACEITVTPGPTWPPTFADTVDAQDTATPSVQADGTLAPGATRYFDLDVNIVRDLVYAEVQGSSGLRVSIFTAGGTRIAVSESPTYFAASLSALSSSAEAVAGSAISVAFPCLGPCVAVPSTASSYVVAVTNTSGSSASFELFAFTIDATDQNEANDSVASAIVLNSGDTDQGAIERLGDTDYFVYDATTTGSFFVVFDPFDLALGLQLEIVDCGDCVVLDGTSGRQVEGLLDGDVLRVTSAAGRAGASATSGYSVQITNDPPTLSVTTR